MKPGMTKVLLSATLAGALVGILVAIVILLSRHTEAHEQTDLHEMLHRAVPLDANEQEILNTKEKAFMARRSEIDSRLRMANATLADAIGKNPEWSSEVEIATKQVEVAAGELQRATLIHVFEMRAGLKPEHRPAYDKVLIEALRRGAP